MKAARPRKTMAIGEASPTAAPSLLTAGAVVLLVCVDGFEEVLDVAPATN